MNGINIIEQKVFSWYYIKNKSKKKLINKQNDRSSASNIQPVVRALGTTKSKSAFSLPAHVIM